MPPVSSRASTIVLRRTSCETAPTETTIVLLMMLALRPATRPRWSLARGNRLVPSAWRTTSPGRGGGHRHRRAYWQSSGAPATVHERALPSLVWRGNTGAWNHAYRCCLDRRLERPPVPQHRPRRTSTVGVPRDAGAAAPPSKSVQPTIASATANSLSSPQFVQFASYLVPENRGVGGSIPPLTTSDPGS